MKEKLISIFFVVIGIIGCSTENENEFFKQYEWESGNLSELNISEELINTAFQKGEELDYLYSILIIRNGKIGAERYFNGHDKDTYCTIRSVSKSFLSAGIGIAINNGLISLDDKLMEFLQDSQSNINDFRINEITIGDLIKMRSGINSDRKIY